MAKITIRKKILIGFVIIIALALINIIIIIPQLNQLSRASLEILPLEEDIKSIQNQVKESKILENGIESYILVKSIENKQKIITSMENIEKENLKIIENNPNNAEVEKIIEKHHEKEKIINSLITAIENKKNAHEINNEIIKMYNVLEEVSLLRNEFIDAKTKLLEENIDEHQKIIMKIQKYLIYSGILIMVLSILISLYLSDKISKSITNLRDVAEKIGKGNLEINAKVNSDDEIGDLAETFNLMAKDLKKSQIKLLKSEKERGKKLEYEVHKKTKELDQKVKDLANTKTAVINMMQDLKETNEHLKDLDQAKSNFLNVVSHELKTPLTAIFAYLDIMEDLKGNLTEDEIKAFEAIKRNSFQLKSLISNILEISRIAAGKFELINAQVDVNQKIKSSVENLTPLAGKKGIKLIANVGKAPLNAITDEQRLDEILNNLISNSIKFTNKGSVTVEGSIQGNFFNIQVIDTGVGIPKDKLKHLGEKFYQVDSSISRKYGGTGLGLSITKQLIELQGGEMKITSVEGKGSTFSVFLPMKQKQAKKDVSPKELTENKKFSNKRETHLKENSKFSNKRETHLKGGKKI